MNNMTLRILLLALLCTGNSVTSPLRASEVDEDETQYEPILVPIIGGSTDIGALFGVQAAVAKLAPGYDPYQWKGVYTVAMSIKDGPSSIELPIHYYALDFDIPGLAGGRLRLLPRAEFRRVVNAGYYGLGNDSAWRVPATIVDERTAFRRNQFIFMMAKARLNARIALPHNFGVMAGAEFRYVMPEIYEGSKLAEDAEGGDPNGDSLVVGTEYHPLLNLMLGIDFDNRDHEANPSRGMYHQLYVRGFPGPLLGMDFPYGTLTLHARFFAPLIGEYLVLATRLRSDLFFGEVPFHELNLGTIRGIPARRYHGHIKLLGNVELRSTFLRFGFKKQRFGVGAAVFFDTGRVFADYEPNPEMDGDWYAFRFGVGGGTRFIWGETRVASIDIAYSPVKAEMNPDLPVGIYLHLGHLF